MMIYTVRFAHLAKRPDFSMGDKVVRNVVIGEMGNTGQSTAPHLHLDVVFGRHPYRYSLLSIEADNPKASPRQAAYFIDKELFNTEIEITTGYADPFYLQEFKKLHLGFDVIPKNRRKENFLIHWNRSFAGDVILIVDNDPGYGNCLYIAYEA